ncbi:MAG TPA: hypothetical protein ENG69_03765 [Candidatus Korarchaeota archaeon]|nr:hypothetical protein [Candidatus Korarchaeota archaeon]
MRIILNAHLKILRRLAYAGDEGVVASELIPSRVDREQVLTFLSEMGWIARQRRFRGERVFITKKGLLFLENHGDGYDA